MFIASYIEIMAKKVVAVLFLQLYLMLASSQESIPVISQHPIGGIYASGVSISLTCATLSPVNTIFWYKDRTQVGSGSTFEIASFSAGDVGNYSCRASVNGVGTVTSAIAELQLAAFYSDPSGTATSAYELTVQINSSLVLSCGSILSTPSATYSWSYSDGTSIAANRDRAVKGIDGDLYLLLIEENNIDTYRCTAVNHLLFENKFVDITLSSNGSIDSPPREVMAAPQDVTAVVGETVFFQCIVGGSPVPTADEIVWSYPEGANIKLSEVNAVIAVRSISVSDAGTYTCSVEQVGSFSASLTVLVPPVLSVSLTSQNITYGQSLSLTCSVSNTLVTQWRWFHNGKAISTAIEGTNTVMQANLSHAGVYQCFAYNAAGNSSSSTIVYVHTIPATIVYPPRPPQLLVFEGADVTYTCTATGAPLPTITWAFNSSPINSNSLAEATSVLNLMDVGQGDEGKYMCRAVNRVGGTVVGSKQATVELIVLEPTQFTSTQPRYILIIGQRDTLPCEVESQDGTTLEFEWTKDGQPLPISAHLSYTQPNISGTLSLDVVKATDSGEYSCLVRTRFRGLVAPANSTHTFTVEAVEETLISPMLSPITIFSSSSFTVRWYFPAAQVLSKITSYTITYRTPNETAPIGSYTQGIDALTQHVFVDSADTPVKPFTTYVVTVGANYLDGGRVLSNTETVTTLEDLPGAVEGVKATVINNTAVLVEWQPPTLRNGIITNYTIRYRQAEGNSVYRIIQLPTNITHFIFTSLLQKASYEIQVAASTTRGMGPYSDMVVIFTEKDQSTAAVPIHQRVWFILVLFVVGVAAVVATVLVVCGLKYMLCSGQKNIYKMDASVGSMNEKLRGRSGFGGAGDGKGLRSDPLSLTEDAMVDYEGRSRRNEDMTDAAYAAQKAMEALEVNSSIMDNSHYRYPPSLSTASRVSSQAPPYINPPPFEEAVKRPRLHSAYSNSTLDNQPPSIFTDSDWAMETNSKTRMLDELDEVSTPPPSTQTTAHSSPFHHPTPPHAPPPPPSPPLSMSRGAEEGCGGSYSGHVTPTQRKYASHGGLNHQESPRTPRRGGRGGEEGGVSKMSPSSVDDLQSSRGYHHLPLQQPGQQRQATPEHSLTAPLSKASSQPNFATFV